MSAVLIPSTWEIGQELRGWHHPPLMDQGTQLLSYIQHWSLIIVGRYTTCKHFILIILNYTYSLAGPASKDQTSPWRPARPREDPVAPGLGPQSCVDTERKGSQPFGFHYPPPYPQEKSEDFPVTSDPSYQQVWGLVFWDSEMGGPFGICMWPSKKMASQVALWVKNPSAVQEMQEMCVQSLDQEDPLEERMATPSNILAWRIPRTLLEGYSP